ncbi:hypothetical protein AJ80_03098 [Polytolypa hystricis UAMH7299]|uniref:DUF7580 domain-containing protein n=1 Tax=Polytolypa hystricis (strain UAMH7299) TaxID=1447883 RepID=A0A2B7YKF1_POLH7|nr:hypothetical protein AJ80_03098 [Polytolypa hystricis UAMH7299]
MQKAILENTLEKSLEGIVDQEDEVTDLLHDPAHKGSSMWKDETFQGKLRKKLGRDYEPFVRTMTELSGLLDELSGTLLSRVETANNVLVTLIEQSHHREEYCKKRRVSKRPILKHKRTRKLANSLYNAIIGGNCIQVRWPVSISMKQRGCLMYNDSKWYFPQKSGDTSTSSWFWQEIEIEPLMTESPASPPSKPVPPLAKTSKLELRPKVQFAIVTSTLDSIPWPQVEDTTTPSISDLCSTLCSVKPNCQQRELIGFITDETDACQKHKLYVLRNLSRDRETQSLEDVLLSSSKPMHLRAQDSFRLSRKDRLFLDATLAYSVLQFHGSWLKSQWRSRDIMFAKDELDNRVLVDHPYLSWPLLGTGRTGDDDDDDNKNKKIHSTLQRSNSALIRNDILFPPGLALVELSLCETIPSLRTPEDDDPLEAIASLKTASRNLQNVYRESGARYRDVVDKCLFWPGCRDAQLDDEEFHATVFESIDKPLIAEYRDIEGRF